jgi:hypothetical protein
MPGLTLDAGALIAVERNDRLMIGLLERARLARLPIAIPAGALAQVWRDGRRQVRLARLLATDEVEIDTLDEVRARLAGQLCGERGTSDIVDASVVICARARGHRVVTSDADDIAELDPGLEIIEV